MARGLEPAFTPGRPVWPLAGMALADFEPDDPDLAIPHGALQNGLREKPERHLPANHNGLITHRPAEPLGPRPEKTRGLQRKWKLALIASCVFHAAVALFFIQATDEAVQVEGADFAGIALLGNSPEDQVKAGEVSEDEAAVDVTMVTMLDAVPVENVEAEAVPVDETVAEMETAEAVTTEVETLKPVEETPVEPVDDAKAEQAQPAERVEAEIAETRPAPAVTETVPEVLATDRAELVDDNNFVQKPAETQAAEPAAAAEAEQVQTTEVEPVEDAKPETNKATQAKPSEAAKVETAEVAKAEPTETKPVEPVEDVKPEPKAEAKTENKPVEKKVPAKTAEKKPAAEKRTSKQKKSEEGKKVAEKADTKAKQSGNRGKSQADAKRGQAYGQENGDNRQASRGGSKNGEVGNAAVSNYPGKVRSKLARVARSVRAKGRGEVVVAFAVGSNGSVRSARVARSSGVSAVDQAALQAIRKASPFPPIPQGAGRSSWEFSIPLAFMR